MTDIEPGPDDDDRIPAAQFLRFIDLLDLIKTEDVMRDVLGMADPDMSPAEGNGHEGSGRDDLYLTYSQVFRVVRFGDIFSSAMDICDDDPTKAELWLLTPAVGLGNRAPMELLSTNEGREMVENYLVQIEYGVYV